MLEGSPGEPANAVYEGVIELAESRRRRLESVQSTMVPIKWQMTQASVALVAEKPIEPMSIAADSLKSKGLAPQEWTVSSAISLPMFAETVFVNRIAIRIEGNRCIFQTTVETPFPSDYLIHDLARGYADATELAVQYQAVGINWQLAAQPTAQGLPFLRNLLSERRDFTEFEPVSINLTKPISDRVCNLSFTGLSDGVSVEVNYHHPVADGGVGNIIADWQKCQHHLQTEIMSIFLGEWAR